MFPQYYDSKLLTKTKTTVKELSFDTMRSLFSQFGYDLREISKVHFVVENIRIYQRSMIT